MSKVLHISNDLKDLIQDMIDETVDTKILTLYNNLLEYNLYRIGVSVPNDNMNNAISDGCYFWTPDTSNRPADGYGTVFTMVSRGLTGDNQSNWINQLAMGTSNTMYFRQKINANAWTTWKQIF